MLAYVLFTVAGVGGFGALSAFLTTVELHEGRSVDDRLMWPAIVLLSVGISGSCLLLGVAGAEAGYAIVWSYASAWPGGTVSEGMALRVLAVASHTGAVAAICCAILVRRRGGRQPGGR